MSRGAAPAPDRVKIMLRIQQVPGRDMAANPLQWPAWPGGMQEHGNPPRPLHLFC